MVSTKPIASSDHRAAFALRCDRCAAWQRASQSICTVSFLKLRFGTSLCRRQIPAPWRFIITTTIERALQALRHIAGAITARLARGYPVIASIFTVANEFASIGMRDLYGSRGLAIRSVAATMVNGPTV